ncbi:MAG: hypothetical protein DRQ47_08000 [Gammaproteobacteria bacterium]|nr:MAG: hypothetical protein DRQ47_08000 [Gammaproteobacteria bacterium]
MYSSNPLQEVYRRNLGGGIRIAVQLYETNFVGLVGGGENPAYPVNKFMLWNDHTKEIVAETREKDTIVGLKINHDVVAVLTRRRIMIYDLENMKLIHSTKTANNPNGICALSSSKGNVFLCPGMETGTVNIIDYHTKTERTVKCHDGNLRTITLNTTFDDERAESSGDTVFATTSDKGTLIRVFDIATQSKIKELRRGYDDCEIYSVEFSPDSKCLAATSSKGNVHIFSLSKDYSNVSSRASFLGTVSSYLGSKWSPFSIAFAVSKESKQNEKEFQRPKRHIACLTTLGNDVYDLLILGVDGSYAQHKLAFKTTKETLISRGKICDVKPALTYAEAVANVAKK